MIVRGSSVPSDASIGALASTVGIDGAVGAVAPLLPSAIASPLRTAAPLQAFLRVFVGVPWLLVLHSLPLVPLVVILEALWSACGGVDRVGDPLPPFLVSCWEACLEHGWTFLETLWSACGGVDRVGDPLPGAASTAGGAAGDGEALLPSLTFFEALWSGHWVVDRVGDAVSTGLGGDGAASTAGGAAGGAGDSEAFLTGGGGAGSTAGGAAGGEALLPGWAFWVLAPMVLTHGYSLCFFWLVLLQKKLLVGKLSPGEVAPADESSWRWQLGSWLTWLHSQSVGSGAFDDCLDPFVGTELLSVIYRALGVKVGQRVQIDNFHLVEHDCVTIDDDVVLGSAISMHCTSHGRREPVHLRRGSNILDHCCVLPGVVVGERAVLGSTTIAPRTAHAESRTCLPPSHLQLRIHPLTILAVAAVRARVCAGGSMFAPESISTGQVGGKPVRLRFQAASPEQQAAEWEALRRLNDEPTFWAFNTLIIGAAIVLEPWALYEVLLATAITSRINNALGGPAWLGLATPEVMASCPSSAPPFELPLPPLVLACALLPALFFFVGVGGLLLHAMLKWVIVGRYQSGDYPFFGSYHCKWMVMMLLAGAAEDVVDALGGTAWMAIYYRLMGATVGPPAKAIVLSPSFALSRLSRPPCPSPSPPLALPRPPSPSLSRGGAPSSQVGKDCCLFGLALEYDLLSLGDRVAIGWECDTTCHTVENMVIKLAPTVVEEEAAVCPHSMLMPGCVLGKGAVLLENSQVLKGEAVPARERWAGLPAMKCPAMPLPAALERQLSAVSTALDEGHADEVAATSGAEEMMEEMVEETMEEEMEMMMMAPNMTEEEMTEEERVGDDGPEKSVPTPPPAAMETPEKAEAVAFEAVAADATAEVAAAAAATNHAATLPSGIGAFTEASIIVVDGLEGLSFLVERQWDGKVCLLPVEPRLEGWRPRDGRGGMGHLRLWAARPGGALTVDLFGGRGRWAQFEVLPKSGDSTAVFLRGVGTGAYLSLLGSALVASYEPRGEGLRVRQVDGPGTVGILRERRDVRAKRDFQARQYLEHRRLAAAAYIMERRAVQGAGVLG